MASHTVPSWTNGSNPLTSDSPAVWDRLMEAVGPASLLVVIESRMGPLLRCRVTSEDIWQETLLSAWRDRAKCEWRGLRSFRNWLLTIIDHRIRDAAEYENAAKRGGENAARLSSSLTGESSDRSHARPYPGPVGSTTPSRIAMHREQAAAMSAALETLPEELREVVRLRLFEQRVLQASLHESA
ncbi:MAG: sigma-70 family RNA polymerase sigma factor [Planctomycetes bacterium]|nr:sigma-70 family RNA polymerase sigma factor [Planctomycetota bacterium]